MVQKNNHSPSLSEEMDKKLVLEDHQQELSLEEEVEGTESESRIPSSHEEDKNEIKVIPLSIDHKPNIPDEKLRIEKAGLEVIEETFPSGDKDSNEMMSVWKIQKSEREKIAVSRAFGDFDYKGNEDLKIEEQAIICVPEITIHKRDNACDKYLVLACDGVFDVMSNEEVGEFVTKRLDCRHDPISAETLPEVGDELLQHCLELGSSDNMSVLIVALPFHDGANLKGATRKLMFADI